MDAVNPATDVRIETYEVDDAPTRAFGAGARSHAFGSSQESQ